MTGSLTHIEELITPTVESLGFKVVRILLNKDRNLTLQIMVEPVLESEMTVEDCALISRSVSAILEIEDPLKGKYFLEISSPGIDRPLTKIEDYNRFTGSCVKIQLHNPKYGRKKFRGILRGIEGSIVKLEIDSGTVELGFGEIFRANLAIADLRSELKKGRKT